MAGALCTPECNISPVAAYTFVRRLAIAQEKRPDLRGCVLLLPCDLKVLWLLHDTLLIFYENLHTTHVVSDVFFAAGSIRDCLSKYADVPMAYFIKCVLDKTSRSFQERQQTELLTTGSI